MAVADNIDWFLGRDGQQYGPIKNDEMQTLVRLGQLRGTDLLWHAGLAAWQPASEIFTLGPIEAPASPMEPSPSTADMAETVPADADVGRRTTEQTADRSSLNEPVASTVAQSTLAQPDASRADHRPSAPPEARTGPAPTVGRGGSRADVAVTHADGVRAQPAAAPARTAATARAASVRASSAVPGKRQRRLMLAGGVSIAAIGLSVASFVYWDDLFGGSSISGPVVADAAKSPTTVPVSAPVQPRPAFAAGQVWGQVQADFPEWFVERMREAERIRRDTADRAQGDPAVAKYLSESLVSLRRNHASDALAASHERIRRVAVAFIDNLTALSAQGTDVCYDFISHGEASDAVVRNARLQPISAGIDTQLTAVFDAIREGRAQPVSHLPPRKSDYDLLADELVKLGWADEDLKVFSDPRLLSRASPEQVCRLVKDWFRAHLAIGDQPTQLRLLVESLKPVVAG